MPWTPSTALGCHRYSTVPWMRHSQRQAGTFCRTLRMPGLRLCFPAVALNDLAADGSIDLTDAASCPDRCCRGTAWLAALPGAYTVLRYGAPVAVCTLNDEALAEAVARARLPELAIVGTLHTENLGIERLIANVIANPHIRFVVVCGPDSRQAIGHLPGQSLVALAQSGIDEHQRIIGAKGKRPVLRNLISPPSNISGHQGGDRPGRRVRSRSYPCRRAELRPARSGTGSAIRREPCIEAVTGNIPARMVSDPAGYFVIFPDRARGLISLEHYANNGVLTAVIEGHTAAELYMTAIDRNLVSRLDHAAYLGRELARAERLIASGEAYVQDAAPEVASRRALWMHGCSRRRTIWAIRCHLNIASGCPPCLPLLCPHIRRASLCTGCFRWRGDHRRAWGADWPGRSGVPLTPADRVAFRFAALQAVILNKAMSLAAWSISSAVPRINGSLLGDRHPLAGCRQSVGRELAWCMARRGMGNAARVAHALSRHRHPASGDRRCSGAWAPPHCGIGSAAHRCCSDGGRRGGGVCDRCRRRTAWGGRWRTAHPHTRPAIRC